MVRGEVCVGQSIIVREGGTIEREGRQHATWLDTLLRHPMGTRWRQRIQNEKEDIVPVYIKKTNR